MVVADIDSTTLTVEGATALTAAAVVNSSINSATKLTVLIGSADNADVSADQLAGVVCRGDFSGTIYGWNSGRILFGGNLSDSSVTAFNVDDPGEALVNNRIPHVIGSFTALGSVTDTTVEASVCEGGGIGETPGRIAGGCSENRI
jgi:hypothetical protein